MKGIWVIPAIVVATSTWFPCAAFADQARQKGDIICSRRSELAVVRFGMSWNDDPPKYRKLPRSLDGGLSSSPPGDLTQCALPSGQLIRFEQIQDESLARGLVGGDPAGYFSLWINGRVVRSRQKWKPRGFDDGQWIAAVVIKGKQVIICQESDD